MAKWIAWIPEQEQEWEKWVESRPESIQEMVKKYDLRMDNLYRLKTTGQTVTLHSLSEDGTVTVNVPAKWNLGLLQIFDKTVFGVDPANLEISDAVVPIEDGRLYWDNAQRNAQEQDDE